MWKKKKKADSSSTKTKKTGENSSLAKSKKFLAKMSDKAIKTGENLSLAKSKEFLTKMSDKASKTVEKASLAKSKEVLAKISDKATNLRLKKKVKNEEAEDGALWRKEILMGDKCKPLNFSGVIYYDRNGNQLPEIPVKSPRASPFPGYLNASQSSERGE